MVITVLLTLSLLLALIARFAVRTLHYFEVIFTFSVSTFLYMFSFAIAAFNYNGFSSSTQLGLFSCFIILGFVAVPSVVLIAVGIGLWRGSYRWKLFVWLGCTAVQLGMEGLAVKGRVIIYPDRSIFSSLAVWIVSLAVLLFLVHLYRNQLSKEVRIP